MREEYRRRVLGEWGRVVDESLKIIVRVAGFPRNSRQFLQNWTGIQTLTQAGRNGRNDHESVRSRWLYF